MEGRDNEGRKLRVLDATKIKEVAKGIEELKGTFSGNIVEVGR